MPLVIRELHPAPSSDALNQEWILIENTGPGAQSVSGCTLAVSASGKRPRPVSNLPDQFIKPGEKVILVDDLIATGGTAEAAVKLLQQMGADIVAACFIIDLPGIGGRKKLEALGASAILETAINNCRL